MTSLKLTLAAALIAAPSLSFADEAADTAVKARQGYFTMLVVNMGTLAGMAKGEMDYDEIAASAAAANIEALAAYNAGIHFVPGTSVDDREDTKAKANIWSDLDGFVGKYGEFQQATAGAAEAVKGGQGNLGPVLQKIGGTCKGCHDTYRTK